MAAVDTGKSFANGEQLTAAKLNQMFGNSTFGSGAVDNSTISIDTSGKLAVNQITSSNIANNAIGLSDLAQVSTDRVLGRLSDESGNVEQITVDEDLTSVSANHDELATSKAIKDYVDTNIAALGPVTAPTGATVATSGTVTLPGGLIMKFGNGVSTIDEDQTFTFPTSFPNNHFCTNVSITQAGQAQPLGAHTTTLSGFTIDRNNNLNGSNTFSFISIGN